MGHFAVEKGTGEFPKVLPCSSYVLISGPATQQYRSSFLLTASLSASAGPPQALRLPEARQALLSCRSLPCPEMPEASPHSPHCLKPATRKTPAANPASSARMSLLPWSWRLPAHPPAPQALPSSFLRYDPLSRRDCALRLRPWPSGPRHHIAPGLLRLKNTFGHRPRRRACRSPGLQYAVLPGDAEALARLRDSPHGLQVIGLPAIRGNKIPLHHIDW